MTDEGMINIVSEILPKEEMLARVNKRASLKIGVLAEVKNDEKRVCLTPESVGILIENGHRVVIQSKAGEKAGYPDLLYSEKGASIVGNFEEVMLSGIVLKVSRLNKSELQSVKKGQLIITSLQYRSISVNDIAHIADKKATAISFENIMDNTKAFPLIRSMSEIVGIAAIQIAAFYLSHPKYGNATLLGGVPGVKPAEVVVIGAGTVSEYAVRTALGMGASVKVFDNSIYKLRRLQYNVSPHIPTSTLQPQVLAKAIKDADIVIGALRQSEMNSKFQVPEYMVEAMNAGSVIVDVSIDQGGAFETSRPTNHENPVYQIHGVTHYCIPNMASMVSNTASQVFSNFFAPLLIDIGENGGVSSYLKKDKGLRNGVYVFNGIVTNAEIGRRFGFSYRDLDLLLAILQ
ncbi:MAG: alanine dehydrogenase [Bacteroidales bacterium]|nr:alanine dehydrogenase [Bacteroidales bacterium]